MKDTAEVLARKYSGIQSLVIYIKRFFTNGAKIKQHLDLHIINVAQSYLLGLLYVSLTRQISDNLCNRCGNSHCWRNTFILKIVIVLDTRL